MSRVSKVLLVNPPAGGPYIRDQFCSHLSKGLYYWQPLDLLMLSARLHADGYELAVVDAVAERLSVTETHERIERFRPEALIFLTGSDSFHEDIVFVEHAKRRGVDLAVGIGDILREMGERLLMKHTAMDACLTDFVTHGLDAFLQGRLEDAENMIVRTETEVRRISTRQAAKTFRMPAPRYQLFPLHRYRMPFNRYHPYAATIASNWCPYRCSFCPFAHTPFKLRDVDDVLDNLEVIRRTGIRQVHFADWTFAVDRRQAIAILQGMIEAKFGFTWSCLSRVDLMDRELMEMLKRSGCDLIEFGVECGNQEMLDRYKKGVTLNEVRSAFRWANQLELSTLATFVLGLPGETRETAQETLDLALAIEPTFCSFNIASPRMGTDLRKEMIADALIQDSERAILDSSRSDPVFSTPQLSAQELRAMRQHAIRRFYLRPSYLARRLGRVRTWDELQNHLGNGVSLIWQSLQRMRAQRT